MGGVQHPWFEHWDGVGEKGVVQTLKAFNGELVRAKLQLIQGGLAALVGKDVRTRILSFFAICCQTPQIALVY